MRYDVAVVGAGPSGSWTATLLARRGVRVALIDPSHPREKPCGGGVTSRALAIVRDAVTLTTDAVLVDSARFVDSTAGTDAIVQLPTESAALLVSSRSLFDGLLYEAAQTAGADVIRARVVDARRHDHGFELITADRTRIATSFLVGADGANSLIRRRMATAFRRRQLSIATGFFAHGVTSSEIVVEMTTDPAGYIWSFPRSDHLAIGICAQADAPITAEALRCAARQWIARTGVGDGARLEPYSWPIPSLLAADLDSLQLSGRRWLTVGDAAGLVDPITREGIFFALQSAVIAADVIASTAADPARAFSEEIRHEILPELKRAARYKAGFFRPGFARLLIKALQSSSRIRTVMADLVAGTQNYRSLEWRLLRTFEFGLAWRVLASRS